MAIQIQVEPRARSKLSILVEQKEWKTVPRSLFANVLTPILHCKSVEELEERFQTLEEPIAKRYAVFLLSKKAYPSVVLRKKLKEKGFSDKSVDITMQYCKKLGALNDEQLLTSFLEKKLTKGYSLYLAKQMASFRFGTAIEGNFDRLKSLENASARKLFNKHFSKFLTKNPKNLQKMINFFLRRGYTRDFIADLLQEIQEGN